MKPPTEHQEVHHRHGGHGGGTLRDRVVIWTVIIGVTLFLVIGTPYLKLHMSPEGAVVNAIGRGDVDSDRDANRDRDPDREPIHDAVRAPVHDTDRAPLREPDRGDPDRDAVRRWLRANGDDPRPREIRWWPTRELTRLYQQRLDAAKEAAEDDPSLSDQVDEIEQDGPDRVCRLKYRTQNQAGDEVAGDDLFIIRQGKARRLAKNSSLASAARRYFPDGEGVP
jgi:hypothetical protein